MKAIVGKKKIEFFDAVLPVEGQVECEITIDKDMITITLPKRGMLKKPVERVMKYLENPDSECDIETMASALEIDTT